jgi:hypothetical protein
MPDFRPFNYAQAVQSGQQVAMNALKLREGVRGIQGRNILSDISAQGLTGFQKYNALQQAGFGGLAQEEQTRELKVAELKSNYAKSQLERVSSYETFTSMARSLDEQGVAPYQTTMDKFGVTEEGDYSQAIIDKFLGRKADVEKASAAQKKMNELIAQGIDPQIAQGIGYGTLTTEVDPTSGDVMIVDKRKFGKPSIGETDIIRKGDRPQQKFDKKVESFSKEIEKSGIVDIESTITDVETMLNEITKDDPNADIPGFGVTAKLPDFAISEEGRMLRQRVATLFNMTLKDRSGAAVTPHEMKRLKEEFGQGLIKTDEQLLDALQRFRGVVDKHKLTLAAGFDDDVVGTWQSRSGMTLRDVTKKEKKAVKRYKVNPQTGKLELQ